MGIISRRRYERIEKNLNRMMGNNNMENEIKKLIDKYDVKTTEEPLNYFQWVEVVEDLESLLKFKQAVKNECQETK